MSVIVALTYPQMMVAGQVALMRRIQNCLRNAAPKHGQPNGHGAGSWEGDIFGCQAEFAVAQYLNLHWDGSVGNYAALDCGRLVEVRSCTHAQGRLILHEEDHDDVPYVLVWTAPPRCTLIGWCFGREGKRAEFWCDPNGGRPAYFVDQSALRPLEELRPWVEAERAARSDDA